MNTFLALGDSYTIGEGVAPGERWPVQLAARLRGEGVAVADPQIVATTGWTTDELLLAMETATFTPPYALVTLLIGVNDQYREHGMDQYRAQFRDLLRRAIRLAAGNPAHVIVVSIPDWGVTPFAAREGRNVERVAREIDAFNAIASAATASVGAAWVDVTAISRQPESRDEWVGDGLHPSGMQYARWTETILPVATTILAGD
ncbi:MAG TPA: SGNH/GDSL hydrolase family protein [Rhodanobacteraceae bacterium]|nr:SGNH/GDSL hydrolase family protein [Rhodanobacteraceae bacterium]